MAIGVYAWIGIKDGTRSTDDDHCDIRTISDTEENCRKKIRKLRLSEKHWPVQRVLILKGRMVDR
jgi:hypothetical protein